MGAEHLDLALGMVSQALSWCVVLPLMEQRKVETVGGFLQVALGGTSKGFAPTAKACPEWGGCLCAPSLSWPARSPTAHLVWKA